MTSYQNSTDRSDIISAVNWSSMNYINIQPIAVTVIHDNLGQL